MKLITKEIEKKAPSLYAIPNVWPKKVIAKFFTPDSSWTWYMTEYDPTTQEAYGLVDGLELEWVYFSIIELETIMGPFGMKIERDIHFKGSIDQNNQIIHN